MDQSEQTSTDTSRPESIWVLMGNTFKGPLAPLAVMMFIHIFAGAGLLIYSAVKFFQVDQIGDQILWATVFLTAFMLVSSLKLFYWMMMFRASAMKRLDRIEKRLVEMKCE